MLGRLNNAIRNQRISREFGIEALREVLETYLPQEQVDEVQYAYQFGAERHEGQYRKSGEAYIYHPLAVARILAEMHLDHTTLMEQTLHHGREDTDATPAVNIGNPHSFSNFATTSATDSSKGYENPDGTVTLFE